MGCRTRANEYYGTYTQQASAQYNTAVHRNDAYVGGNVVRKTSEAPRIKKTKLKRHTKKKASIRQSRALAKQGICFAIFGSIGAFVFAVLCISMLTAIDKNNVLTKKINNLESNIQEMTNQNDAREYEINSTVDLNHVIEVATEELGMVRSSVSQIRYYSVRDTEYLQQVAEVPRN